MTFDIKIIGAGVCGLGTALAISKLNNRTPSEQKYKITIYEASPTLSEFGAGIQLAANATRILYDLGVGEAFEKVANAARVNQVRRYADDSFIGEIAQNPMSEWEYGFPHWQVFRPDFQRLLAEACEKEGEERVKVVFGKRVKAVVPETGKILFEDGAEESADLVIAADGLRGRVRHCIPQNEGILAKASKEYCFRAVVPREKMLADPVTAELMEANSLNMIWVGPSVCMLGYPVAGGSLYNIVLSNPTTQQADEEAVAKWSQPGDVKEGALLLSSFCPRARKLWSMVEECNKWTLGDLPPLPTYVSDSGKLALVGDCAHAILPHSGQGGCQAMEDAASLAECVSAVGEGRSDLKTAMHAWSKLRQGRMEVVRRMAAGNQHMLTMPDGPDQEKRDGLWAAMTEAWKEELAEIGEQGIKAKPKAKPEMKSEDLRSPETRMYIYGYSAAEEARKAVAVVA